MIQSLLPVRQQVKHKMSSIRTTILLGIFAIVALTGCTAEMKKSRWLGRAERDFEAGDYDRAKIDYMKVLQVDPQNTRAFQQLGAIWLEEGAPLRAGAFLRRARELDPKDSTNLLRLARVYRAVGQREEAKKEALAALQQSPGNGEALLLLTEFAGTEEEVEGVSQALQKFPGKEASLYQLATANMALRKKDIAGAQVAINRAIELDPKSAEAQQAAGVLALLQKKPGEAGEKLKMASDLSPPRSTVQMIYAEYLRQHEGPAAATTFLNKLTDRAPDFLPAWIFLARIVFAEKKYDEVSKILESVFFRDPQNIDARMLQSDAWLVQNETTKATEALERLDTTYPGLAPVKYRLAQAYLKENKLSQASTALDQALAANTEFVEAILLKAQLNLRTGNAAGAIASLEELVKKRAEVKPALLLLADSYRAAGRLDDAANIFEEQIRISPSAPEPYFFLGVVRQQQKKTEEARQSFRKVLELAPDNILAIGQLIDLDLQEKDFPAATRLVQAQLQENPKAAPLHLLDGRIQMAQHEWQKAETALKQSLALDAGLSQAYEMLVSVYLATDRLSDALREIETVLSKAPENKGALMTLAVIQEKQKRYEKASETYEKLLALDPNFVPALNNLAYLCAERLGRFDKSYELARKARSLDSTSPAVADTLGWALFKRGDYQQALALLEESVAKSTGSPEIGYHLGMTHYMMGHENAARTAFQKAIAAKEDFPSRTEAESRLAVLGDGSGASRALSVGQLEQLLKDQPNDLITRIRLAEQFESQGAWTEAAEAYEDAMKLNPNLASTALKLAQLYSGPASNKEKALTYAKMARGLSPNDPKATSVLGRVALDTGDFAWGYSLLQESARKLATDPKVLHDLAWAAYSIGKVDDAREAMARSLKASPDVPTRDDAIAFLDLTAIATGGADTARAMPLIEKTLSAQPKYVPALMAAAALALETGKPGEAIGRCREVLQRFPEFAPAQKLLASLYANEPGQLSQAYDLAVKARKALPDDPAVAQLLGRLSYEKKEYPRAVQLLRESADKKPLDSVGLYYLGLSYKESNEPEKARQNLTDAISRGLSSQLAREAHKALSELGNQNRNGE